MVTPDHLAIIRGLIANYRSAKREALQALLTEYEKNNPTPSPLMEALKAEPLHNVASFEGHATPPQGVDWENALDLGAYTIVRCKSGATKGGELIGVTGDLIILQNIRGPKKYTPKHTYVPIANVEMITQREA